MGNSTSFPHAPVLPFPPVCLQYKKYRNKGVVASARALLNLIRDIFPALLRKRDWGRDVAVAGGAAHTRPTSYGYQLVATGCVAGQVLLACTGQGLHYARERACVLGPAALRVPCVPCLRNRTAARRCHLSHSCSFPGCWRACVLHVTGWQQTRL